ncbi:MAG: PKD domain-containing protein, partial [Bacteroidia bacterium]|nr:PKD domain-containing protein [Bacteroidia bacterium]
MSKFYFWIALIIVFIGGQATLKGQVFFTETFDSPAPNWTVGLNNPTPPGIPGLSYTTLGPSNESCNNYWVINNAHTPDRNNGNRGQRQTCDGAGPGYTWPNPDGGLNNKSLHITYRGSCALIGPAGLGAENEDPDYGDAYSWYDDDHQPNDGFPHLSASDQIAFMNYNINTVGKCNLTLRFLAYMGGDLSSDLTDRSVLYSIDGGTTWKTLAADLPFVHFTAGACKPWDQISLSLPAECENITTLRLAFRWRNDNPWPMTTNDYSYSSSFNIDNITIESAPAPIAGFTMNPSPACRNQSVTLTDATNPNGNPIVNYLWTFTPATGVTFISGTPTSPSPVVAFNPGSSTTYTIRLTTSNPCGLSTFHEQTLNVNLCPPTPQISLSSATICSTNPTPSEPTAPTVLTLTDASTVVANPITSRNWTITPGTFSYVSGGPSSPSPQVQFSAVGTYTISLSVTNADGTSSTSTTVTVTSCECGGLSVGRGNVYQENFDAGWGGWTITDLGSNAQANTWYVSNQEAGALPGDCGFAGGSNLSLHVGSTTLGDIGAAYDAGCGTGCTLCSFFGICIYTATNKRVQSPNISTVGYTNLVLTFNFIGNGQGTTDYAFFEYSTNGGATWTTPTIPPLNNLKSSICPSAQG